MNSLQNCKRITSLHLQNGSTVAADLASVADHENFYTYELVEGIAKYILERVDIRPKIGIICGSGMDLLGFSGPLADMLTDSVTFPYEKIPYFPQSTVPGHEGRLVFGMIKDIPVVCMQGRFHYYEGYPLWKCSMPVRVMKLIGITHLIVSNAGGGINPNFEAGDIMIIKDHVNLMGFAGNNPLQGVNDDRFGPRFIAMNKAYDVRLRKIAKTIANGMGIEDFLHEGVYAVVGGPNFETVAELRMLQTCGVDAVGMSTVAEVLTGCHSGMTIFAFSLITNKCIMDYDSHEEANHTDVIEIGKKREPVVKEFVTRIVQSIAQLQEYNNTSDNGC